MLISIETWIAYTAACILIILAPGPDNILAISRGLSQGRLAALVSSAGASCGLMIHVLAAVFGLVVLMQTSVVAFTVVKIVGAAYLIWVGLNILRSRDMISLFPEKRTTMSSMFVSGFLTNLLNPKPALFVLAFLPQFVSPVQGAVEWQSLVLGIWLVLLAFVTFTLLGIFSSFLSQWLQKSPRTILGLNLGAGAAFIAAGLSVALLERPSAR
ncbi:LysE family translocator [Billgrantia sp. C5P2]|uniref:LysE family translocator n=1 Tax=Billgrantia sp. C5P2 TaxID=3436239 RepID=UPI003DA523DB